MRKIDHKQKQSGGSNNGFIPNSFRSLSSYLRIVSSGASTVASTVRSAASAASTIVDRDTDVVPDQVLWAGFDKLECEGDVTRLVLLLGYQYGFQVWDVEDANNVRNIVSRYDGAVFFMQILPKPVVLNHSRVEYADDHPLLVICADGSFSSGGNAQSGATVTKNSHDQVNGVSTPTVVWFYSLKSQSYVKELKFRSVVYSVRCSSRIVAVLQAAQVHCFDVKTLERDYTILTNPIVTSSSRFDNIGLGPLAVGPRWIAYSGSVVALPNTRVTPQHVTHSGTFSTAGSNGSIVAHYAKQSSKQLAVGIVTLGDIGYRKLSRYYSEFLPDGSISQPLTDSSRKDRATPNGRLPDTENVGMVIVRDVVSKAVIAQFKAHDSAIASLCFDPSGTLLVTASVHGHNFNVFRITPGLDNGASFIHLYKLQRGFTNAVIQDISFSVDSRWITISSSRGTSHLFAISPSGGPVNIQSAEESMTTNQEYNYDAANKPPIALSAVSRIRSGNSGWRNVVTGAAVAASGRNNTYSGVIASTFHKCKGTNLGANVGSRKSKHHLLVFSSSGSVIQYALRVSSEVDTTYESSPDHDSRLIVEPIQKWNICNKQNRREREENVDIYGENGHAVNRKVFPERTESENIDYFDRTSKVKRDKLSLEEKNHVYISEVELQMHQLKIPLWARAQINFQILTIDDVMKDSGNYLKGESEIEKIPTHTVEARSRYLVPAIDHFQRPRVQLARFYEHDKLSNGSSYEHEKFFNGRPYEYDKLSNGSSYENEKLSNGSSFGPIHTTIDTIVRNGGFENGDEETGGYARQMPVKDTNGFVNNDSSSLISQTQPETVNNREHSVRETQSELVNNNIGQKLENHFEDHGDEFD
ncbi:autophagy-related protein 18f-like isoform X2 [Rutidosis leptorrhynchoides]|uniref:autophagy-related protein 18f-like isoform X2 n=1 Tax=Rutidosis leptorrhynchoides TaxID=125765 RepID=UPI003A9A17A3